MQNLFLMPAENEARWLLDVDLFLEDAIEKRRLNIHVEHCPAL